MLVHCAAGVSRSASVVIAYVMRQRNLPFAEARARVKVGRSGRGRKGAELLPMDTYDGSTACVRDLKPLSPLLRQRDVR